MIAGDTPAVAMESHPKGTIVATNYTHSVIKSDGVQFKRGDRVRLDIPSWCKRGRIAKMHNRWATVINVVDNSLDEYNYPVVVAVDGYGKIAVRESEVTQT